MNDSLFTSIRIHSAKSYQYDSENPRSLARIKCYTNYICTASKLFNSIVFFVFITIRFLHIQSIGSGSTLEVGILACCRNLRPFKAWMSEKVICTMYHHSELGSDSDN